MDPLSGLNQAQRAAVEHGADGRSGPLIVLAGPGTGKTRVIVHRVARLIESGAEPASVLAVTFTNKAARQLRERLRELVGNAADQVRASTFHSLGLSMVRRFASDLGLPPVRNDSAILDSAQRTRLMREAILRQGLFADSRAAGLDAAVEFACAQMHALCNHGRLPEDALAFALRWQQSIARGLDSAGRELPAEGAEAEAVRHARFAAAAKAYAWFSAECRRRGWLAFDDLILHAIRLLRENAGAAAIVRSELRHAVVDEFQDVNAGQIELLRLLFPPRESPSTGGEAPGPDLCIVGDDDQAIYGFRGADDQAFIKFDRIWPGARRITLSENYRSERAIIDAANHTIGLADSRFAPEKQVERARLLADAPAAPGTNVECIELDDEAEASGAIAAMILTDRAAGPVPDRPWSAYAVVCRTNTHVGRVAAALRLEGIPVRASKPESLLDDDGVQDVLAFVELLANPGASWSARRLLVRAPLAADAHAVMHLERQFRAEIGRARFEGAQPRAARSFCEWLAAQADLPPAVRSAAERLVAWNAELAALAARERADEVIQRIVSLIDAAHADLLPGRARARRITALVALIRFARLAQTRLEPPGDVREFWSYWNDLDDGDRQLESAAPIESRVQDDEEALAAGSPDAEGDGPAVAVLTAHKAKGLEWDTVFVPNVSPTGGFGKSERPNADEALPAGLTEAAPGAAADRAEERRVFYVACTRAQRRLVLLARRNKSPSRSVHFFEEFTRNPAGLALVTIRPGSNVFTAAAEALGGRLSRAMTDRLDGETDDIGAFDRARRDARLAAAEALERMEAAGAGERELAEATARLRGAAARLAVAAHVERERTIPDWLERASEPGLDKFAAALIEARARDDRAPAAAPRPPLSLSFTSVQAYLDCPRCYWLRFMQNLPERERRVTATGTAVHEALERFYLAVRAAESAGEPAPTRDDLLAMGREAFLAHWPSGEIVDEGQFEQTAAQLRLMLDRLHDPNAQVLEVEHKVRWDYRAADPDRPGAFTTHRFDAKIDRIDQITLPDGRVGFRLVDYKSGGAWKKFKEIESADLQMGIYALALPHIVADIDLAATLAEYWLLSTGERGSIRMSDLDLDKVRATIDKAVGGILAGHFPPSPKCKTKECLNLPGPPEPAANG
ncbi:MAG: ATP-dependent helicase [Phycisphaeraceae bacterium]|nr:ATP-dependent helicase [Phycisphaeraceae bacterium]